MTDNELRGLILRRFYEARRSDIHKLTEEERGEVGREDYNRIGQQLRDHGLLDWWQPISGLGSGRITARGVDVVEGVVQAPVSINLNDNSVAVHGSQNVQIGNGNSIKADTSIDIQKVMSAIDQSLAPTAEKEEAKSLLAKLSDNATFATIVGAIVTLASGGAN
ncbi:hypothetical protein HCU64_12710 [Methylobacterium sp. C25]|uniref:hypothetical protein n=1 Tax=Methylobacterium sp. C25 TaxID=2721622 RepID=UPI001F202280|nr:hypothetical protein [Methylobacterium sp. C25]MCE4224619.1 hypothetical protein [Methylobacterium sp. C25]